jgi:hypothetical protein
MDGEVWRLKSANMRPALDDSIFPRWEPVRASPEVWRKGLKTDYQPNLAGARLSAGRGHNPSFRQPRTANSGYRNWKPAGTLIEVPLEFRGCVSGAPRRAGDSGFPVKSAGSARGPDRPAPPLIHKY